MLKKFLSLLLSMLLVFSLLVPSAFGASNGDLVQNPGVSNLDPAYSEYNEVLYGNAWEKRYYITLIDKLTGEELNYDIPTVNNGTLSQEDFEKALPEHIVLVEFKEVVNPNVEVIIKPQIGETLFDVGAFVISLFEFYEEPDLWNGVAVIINGGAVILPFVPAVGSLTVNAIKSSPKMQRAIDYGIRPYTLLRNEIAGTGLHAHHIMRKKFSVNFNLKGRENDMFCLTLDSTTHNMITGRFNSRLSKSAETYTAAEVRRVSIEIYDQLYRETGDYIFKFQSDFIKLNQYAP